MATPKIFESEYRFCLILWEREPVSSAELAKICKEKLGWSRTTTYTVIHRLSERGVVKPKSCICTRIWFLRPVSRTNSTSEKPLARFIVR